MRCAAGTKGERHRPGRRRRGWIGSGLACAALLAIVGGWISLGTTSPVATVATGSMVPTLKIGDVILLARLHGPPHLGEIVQAPVPLDVQHQFHYPPAVTHRIVAIKDGMVTTKGDANKGDDPFDVPVSAIHVRVVRVIPFAGRAERFVMSPFGLVWLLLGAVLLLGPKVVETLAPTRGDADDPTIRQLVLAIAEYGEHLQSHTQILQSMSTAAQDLAAVAAELKATPRLTRAEPTGEPAAGRRRTRTPLGEVMLAKLAEASEQR